MKSPKEIYYKLTELEQWEAKEFIRQHKGCREAYREGGHEAIPPRLVSYIIGSNSVADTIAIRCDWCKEEKDISDTSVW